MKVSGIAANNRVDDKGKVIAECTPLRPRGNVSLQPPLHPGSWNEAEVDMKRALRLSQKVMRRVELAAELYPVECMVRTDETGVVHLGEAVGPPLDPLSRLVKGRIAVEVACNQASGA
jgi:hypothetical protein